MDVSNLLTNPATIHRRAATDGEDELGNPTPTWVNVETFGWIDARGNNIETTEDIGAADWQVETRNAFLLPDPQLTGRDRVSMLGETFEIVGPPHTFTHPKTRRAVYTQAVVRSVT